MDNMKAELKKLKDELEWKDKVIALAQRSLAEKEEECEMLKIELEYAIADIPHKCYSCMSNRCYYVCDCDGCDNGSHWRWYGAMGG